MNRRKILNNLNYLKKVSLGNNNNILLSFGDIPNFTNQDIPGFLEEAKDYLEVIDVKLKGDISKLYWKLHRYSGELMFLHLDEKGINIFDGEITEHQEEWNFFDDIEHLDSIDYQSYQVLKTAEDWKNDFLNCNKALLSLLK